MSPPWVSSDRIFTILGCSGEGGISPPFPPPPLGSQNQEGTNLPLLNVLGGDILLVLRYVEDNMIDINANINILILDYRLSFRESRHSLPEK